MGDHLRHSGNQEAQGIGLGIDLYTRIVKKGDLSLMASLCSAIKEPALLAVLAPVKMLSLADERHTLAVRPNV